MTWIKTISPREDPGVRAAAMAARNVFPASYTQSEPGGSVPPSVMADSIVLSHSLIPDVMHYMFTGIGLMMSDDLPLSRREHELIATTTSAINACFYWSTSHAEFLRVETLDASFAAAIRQDWRTAPGLSEREIVILTYVDKVTRTPAKVVPEDLEPLRLVGLDDRGILQVLMICAAFNYLNRIADGIGVGKGTIANPFMP